MPAICGNGHFIGDLGWNEQRLNAIYAAGLKRKKTYIHGLQEDVIGPLDSAGVLIVEYKYDAWGKLLSTSGTLADTLGKRNPFRYRVYVYDEESGLYYLRSRYYNPEWVGLSM